MKNKEFNIVLGIVVITIILITILTILSYIFQKSNPHIIALTKDIVIISSSFLNLLLVVYFSIQKLTEKKENDKEKIYGFWFRKIAIEENLTLISDFFKSVDTFLIDFSKDPSIEKGRVILEKIQDKKRSLGYEFIETVKIFADKEDSIVENLDNYLDNYDDDITQFIGEIANVSHSPIKKGKIDVFIKKNIQAKRDFMTLLFDYDKKNYRK